MGRGQERLRAELCDTHMNSLSLPVVFLYRSPRPGRVQRGGRPSCGANVAFFGPDDSLRRGIEFRERLVAEGASACARLRAYSPRTEKRPLSLRPKTSGK